MVAVPLGAGVDLRRWGGGTGALPAAVAPALVQMPQLAGTGRIGEPVSLQPGVWSGSPAPVLAQQWLRDGLAIPGATGASYLPVAADDEASLACRVTATNAGGSAAAETAGLAVTYAAPLVLGTLADLVLFQGSNPQTVAAAAVFAGENLTFAVSGAGATIDPATGLVSIPAAAALIAETVSVSASNSGGSAGLDFTVTVIGAPVAAGGSSAWAEAADDGLQTFDAAARFTIAGDPAGTTAAYALLAGGLAVEAGVFAAGVFVALEDGYVSIDPATGMVSVDTGESGVLDDLAITVRASNGAGHDDLTITLRVGQPEAAVTWNPADKNSNVTLSDGDRLAMVGSANAYGVRATKYLSAANDDAYFELLIEGAVLHGSGGRVGLITSSISLSSALSLSTGSEDGVLTTPAGSSVYVDTVDVGSSGIGTWNVVGEVLCVAVKMSVGKVFFRLDGGSWTGDPVAGTGGYDIGAASVAPMIAPRRNTGEPAVPGVRLRSLASEFTQAVPSGFVSYAQA